MPDRLALSEPCGGWPPPWPRVRELVAEVGADGWFLVGGLMVQVHARAAGFEPLRATSDIDIAVHIEIDIAHAAQVKGSLERLGYRFRPPGDHGGAGHKFLRGRDEVDLLINDHVGPMKARRWPLGRAVEAPGGSSALRYHTADVDVTAPDGEQISFRVPDLLGALSMKSGAYIVDSRDRRRHLEDVAVLLAAARGKPGFFANERGSDMRRIRRGVAACLNDGFVDRLPRPQRTAAHLTLRELAAFESHRRIHGAAAARASADSLTPDRL